MPFLKAGMWGSLETTVIYGVLGLWWWMLLMTGVYFHTWTEKVAVFPSSSLRLQSLTNRKITGLIIALLQWGSLYLWALKTQPQARVALGVPGI